MSFNLGILLGILLALFAMTYSGMRSERIREQNFDKYLSHMTQEEFRLKLQPGTTTYIYLLDERRRK